MSLASFSDEQLDALMVAARPLPPERRAAFLHAVAHALEGAEIGEGVVHRIAAAMQRRYLEDERRGREPYRRRVPRPDVEAV